MRTLARECWEMVIAPKQTITMNVGYAITYPEQGTVSNLP